MRRIKVNCGAEITPSKFENGVDDEFMADVGSILTLEDGSSLDLKKAVLLYDPQTKKIQLSDSEAFPENYQQVATLNITSQKPDLSEDIVDEFAEAPEGDDIDDLEAMTDEDLGEDDAGGAGSEDIGDAKPGPQREKPDNKRPSADFFQ